MFECEYSKCLWHTNLAVCIALQVSIIFEIVEQIMILPVIVCGLGVVDSMSEVSE